MKNLDDKFFSKAKRRLILGIGVICVFAGAAGGLALGEYLCEPTYVESTPNFKDMKPQSLIIKTRAAGDKYFFIAKDGNFKPYSEFRK